MKLRQLLISIAFAMAISCVSCEQTIGPCVNHCNVYSSYEDFSSCFSRNCKNGTSQNKTIDTSDFDRFSDDTVYVVYGVALRDKGASIYENWSNEKFPLPSIGFEIARFDGYDLLLSFPHDEASSYDGIIRKAVGSDESYGMFVLNRYDDPRCSERLASFGYGPSYDQLTSETHRELNSRTSRYYNLEGEMVLEATFGINTPKEETRTMLNDLLDIVRTLADQ